jgi:hypothetical protein
VRFDEDHDRSGIRIGHFPGESLHAHDAGDGDGIGTALMTKSGSSSSEHSRKP